MTTPPGGPAEIGLPYDSRTLTAKSRLSLEKLEPKWPRPLGADTLRGIFPLEAVRDFLSGRKKVTVIVPDQTRRCEAPLLLEMLEPALSGRKVTLLAANGLHPPMDEKTVQGLYGGRALSRWPLVQHDARAETEMVHIGDSPAGNPIYLNRLVVEADALLALSSISLHYFAGFGGGRKMLLPGTAKRASIITNHQMVLTKGSPGPGRLAGNPLHREMAWVEKRFEGRLFHLITGLSDDFRLAALWGGEGSGPLRAAGRWVMKHHTASISRRYPFAVVSCGGTPKDINVIQAHKSLEFAHRAVRERGVIIFAAACPQGVGSKEFMSWFRFAERGERAWKDGLLNDYQVNGQTALAWSRKCRSHEVWMLTDLPADTADRLGVRRLSCLEEGIADLEKRFGESSGVFIPHAASVMPVPCTR